MAKQKTRSPLKAKPLRNPGQSAEEQLSQILNDKVTDLLVSVTIVAVMFMSSLMQYFLRVPPGTMVVVTAFYLVVALLYAVPRIMRLRKKAKSIKQGRDGERAVAEYLDTLRSEGWRVIHDIVGDNFNLDHVVISPHGIFTVETKTISKPETRDAKVVYDGDSVTVGGFTPDRNPVTQAKAQASWLRTLLSEMTGKAFTIRPVVVYPGWYVERGQGAATQQVLVMEPKELGKFIKREPVHLQDSDIALVTHSLKRHVRASWDTDKK